ncbi:MAG: type II secretion system protein J [Myxococcota bacterium]
MRQTRNVQRRAGFTLIEALFGLALTAVLMLAMTNVIRVASAARADTATRDELVRDTQFAMNRMERMVRTTSRLLVPFGEDPNTGSIESVFEPGVLVVPLPAQIDRDLDGFADADNDRDGLVDEDLPADMTNDSAPGIYQVDDDNSGIRDISFAGPADDDETGFVRDEDPINGIDDDGDGAIDEDPGADMNGDGAPGIAGFDDDGDGSIDEGDDADDDEDGQTNEDWFDPVVYFLDNENLVERLPNLNPASGRDFTDRVIATGVIYFRVARLPLESHRSELVRITLRLVRDDLAYIEDRTIRVGVEQ